MTPGGLCGRVERRGSFWNYFGEAVDVLMDGCKG